ncbi:hypothetical protein PHLCEN_2v5346 [Hermanssonia centrifuga]|uniref:cyclin-dependent kinase n=1 Tax=Hermanssonia centrifuga TaxID=98765 RepID=A0A2R6P5N0_9APHY|nr:hypothetical protein PHLCEN_2v5346 [Hermanssonia centrifuga]
MSADDPGPSTPSRKRSRWDLEDDPVQTPEYLPTPPTKRQTKPNTSTPAPSTSGSRQVSVERKRPLHSIYVPPRTFHPAILPSRSVYCYERLNSIEEGSYGVVFRARDKQTGDIVALKRLKLDEEKQGFPITALREINALMSCRHENVVGIREVVVGDTLTHINTHRGEESS